MIDIEYRERQEVLVLDAGNLDAIGTGTTFEQR